MAVTVVRSSRMPASAEAVWGLVTRMPAINREMGPWLRMTYPREAENLSLGDTTVRLGEPLFTSWVLAGGLVPIERMAVTLVELEPGRRFVEQSRTLAMRSWRHERTLEPSGDECIVTDRLTLAAPVRWVEPLLGRALGLFFDHRHRRLRRAIDELP
jgi:ligand-binding SRPBCC domain-containing protein